MRGTRRLSIFLRFCLRDYTLLEDARRTVARAVNSVMTAAYWEMGRRIAEGEQGGKKRASYGEQLLAGLAQDLTTRFGRGFGRENLRQMRNFHLAYPMLKISQTASGKFALAQIAQRTRAILEVRRQEKPKNKSAK